MRQVDSDDRVVSPPVFYPVLENKLRYSATASLKKF